MGRRGRRRARRFTAPAAAVAALITALAPAASATTAGAATGEATTVEAAIAGVAAQLHVRATTGGPVSPAAGNSGPFTAADLQEAYRLPSGRLGGQTIAIVVPYDNTGAESDLRQYRAGSGMHPCDAEFPCFKKIDQRGGDALPPPMANWALNGVVGLEMASAACPNCKLLLVEADDESIASMGAAVDQAAAQGADAVAVMWGYTEFDGQSAYAAHFDHPGMPITAASGSGFNTGGRAVVPAAYSSVVAVGGTELWRDPATARGWQEAAWRSTGSGCSLYEPRPRWQRKGDCGGRRTLADVSSVASEQTPVQIYSSLVGGWASASGTPVAAAFIAGVYGLAGNTSTAPAGKRLYATANSEYLFDITTGANGTCAGSSVCTAAPHYDGPSGMGTPNGTGAF